MLATVYLILATVYWLPRYWAAAINLKGQKGRLQFIGSVQWDITLPLPDVFLTQGLELSLPGAPTTDEG